MSTTTVEGDLDIKRAQSLIYSPPLTRSTNWKHWLSIEDHRRCEACKYMHGKIYPTIHLDLTNCATLFDLHGRIRKAFDFPDFYGENRDAFYDLLSTEVPATRVIITGEYSVSPKLREELQLMHSVLQDTQADRQRYGIPFSFEILN